MFFRIYSCRHENICGSRECWKLNWTFKMVRILRILKWTWFCFILPVEGTQRNATCFDNCNYCKSNVCHTVHYSNHTWTNVCSYGCIDGHRGARCYELCTYNNRVSCEMDVNICTACKDGFYNKEGSTTCPYSLCPNNCKCNDGKTCTTCKNGFFDTGNDCNKECPSNCLTCSSRETCNECKTGFYNGYEFDNNVKQLFNNCTFKCIDSCKECKSYGSCLQCVKEKYGPTCQNNCSIGCRDQTCDIESGNCICSSNFDGDKCTDCVSTKYETYCNETCPESCKNSKCTKTSGYCSEGCITDTITGETCNVCALGMHGIVCNKTCPLNCKGKTFNRKSGFCSRGCDNNFQGPFCDTCIQGKYGTSCKQNCSLKCTNALCEKETGNCFSCIANFDGDMCNTCENGFYGLNCISLCPSQCFNKSVILIAENAILAAHLIISVINVV